METEKSDETPALTARDDRDNTGLRQTAAGRHVTHKYVRMAARILHDQGRVCLVIGSRSRPRGKNRKPNLVASNNAGIAGEIDREMKPRPPCCSTKAYSQI